MTKCTDDTKKPLVTEELQNDVTALTHCVRKQWQHSRHIQMATMGKNQFQFTRIIQVVDLN